MIHDLTKEPQKIVDYAIAFFHRDFGLSEVGVARIAIVFRQGAEAELIVVHEENLQVVHHREVDVRQLIVCHAQLVKVGHACEVHFRELVMAEV
mgnify:CR=1 FL=1